MSQSSKRRYRILLWIIAAAILIVALGLLASFAYLSAGITALTNPSVTEDDSARLVPLPTSASLAQVPELISPLLPTSTPSESSFFQGGQSAGLVVPEPEPIAPPGRLIIPGLEVEKDIEMLFLAEDSWDIQTLGAGIGLLEATGRHPNDHFSMVFAGHVSTDWSPWGPFANLSELEDGAQVIYQWNGDEYVYEISGRRQIQPSDGRLLFQENEDMILLLTCIGYDPFTGDYDERLLVEAKLVSD